MLVALVILLLGVGCGAFARQLWGYHRVSLVVVPALVILTLWNWVVFPVVVAGAAVTFGVLQTTTHWRGPNEVRVSVAGVVGAAVPAGVHIVWLPVHEAVAVLAALVAAVTGYTLSELSPDRRRMNILTAVGTFLGLLGFGLTLLWIRVTPPCYTCSVLPRPLRSYHPRLLLHPEATGYGMVLRLPADGAVMVSWLSIAATGIGTLMFLYLLLSMVGAIRYTAQRGTDRVENLTFVLVTIASESVRDALFETIEHNRALFDDYPFTVLIDEGADLQPELEAMDVDLVVVPESYDTRAIAKGRAMQYFVENHVTDEEWYAFLDDDNLIQGREFLYEIPTQEAAERLVMNAVLIPRKGDALIPFVIDHMRTLFDFSFFRTFTGVLGRPYAGLHGELLCARGDVLQDIGFDRKTIVEDFAFADNLVRAGIQTWQSQTRVSILSPHSLADYYTQRSRWFRGKLRWLPRSTPGVIIVTGLIQSVWLLGIFGGWLVGGLWFVAGPPAKVVYLYPALLSAGFYSSMYTIGVARTGLRNLPKVVLLPLYATIEHTAPYVALIKRSVSFDVIKK